MIRLSLLLAFSLCWAIVSAHAGIRKDCGQSARPEVQLSGCSAIIHSGKWSGKNLSIVYNNRGRAYYNLSQHTRAISDYTQALQLNPNLAEAYNNLGYVYDELSQYTRALKNYDHALKLKPKYAEAYANRGYLYHKLGKYQDAVRNYNHALRFNPYYSEVYANRASSYRKLGKYDKAVRNWEHIIEIKGSPWVKFFKKHMKEKGHYTGEIDGKYDSVTRAALSTCARDPKC